MFEEVGKLSLFMRFILVCERVGVFQTDFNIVFFFV